MVPEASEQQVVLVTRFSAIGDVAMTIPVVYGAARCNPSVKFVVVTRSGVKSLWVNPPANVTVEGVDLNDYKGVAGMFRLMRHLRKTYHPTVMADLHDVLRTKIMRLVARLTGMKVAVIDKGRAMKRRLVRKGALKTAPLPRMTTRYSDVFNQLGFLTGETGMPLSFADGTPLPVELPAGVPLIGIAPFAAHPNKIYPSDRVAEVVDILLQERPSARIYLFGGGGREKEILDSLAASRPDSVVNLAGRKLGFGVEMEIMSHLSVMLTMDSSNMHLAHLAGVPVVSVWGATHPSAGFCPPGVKVIQKPALPCRPCSVYGNRPCRLSTTECLDFAPSYIASQILSLIPRQ